MHDIHALAIEARAAPPPAPGGRRLGRLTLDIRQHLSPLKQAAFLVGSLAIGLPFRSRSRHYGVAPGTLVEELATVFNVESLRAVLVQAAPLTLVGLGASLAFRIGFWNLGLEGQMIFGGIAATGVAIYGIGPEPMRLVVMGAAAAAAGLLWLLLTAWLKMKFRVNEIIATLLLNYVAVYFLFHLLYGAWQDPKTAFPQATSFRPFERPPELGFRSTAPSASPSPPSPSPDGSCT